MLLPRLTFAAPTRAITPLETPQVPPPEDTPVKWLRTSPLLIPIPPVSSNHALVFPGDFASGADLLAAAPDVDDIILVCDGLSDFNWGLWEITSVSGTAERYRTIRIISVDGDDYLHPCARRGGNEAIVEGIRFNGTSSYWIVSGLTQDANLFGMDSAGSSHHIVWDRCLITGSLYEYGWLLRAGSNCVVQRCLALNPAVRGLIGINPKPDQGAMTGWMALDNEIVNYVDSLLVDRKHPEVFTNIDGLTEGNDYYITEDQHLSDGTAPFENGIDIKGSSDAVQSVSRNDRIRNMRQSSPGGGSSKGDGFEVHRQARNWLVDGLFVDNGPYGYFATGQDSPTDPDTPRDILFRECQFTRIAAYADNPLAAGAGAVFRLMNNEDIADSWFADCGGVVFVDAAGTFAGGPVFNNNTRINTPTYVPGTLEEPYVEANNNVGDPSAERQYIQCNRWTGPILVRGARTGAALENREPVAMFGVTIDGGIVDVADQCIAYDATIVSYSYDWGDGTAPSTTASPSHTYFTNGIFTITLNIEDSNGLTHFLQRNVWITESVPSLMPRIQTHGTVLETTAGGAPGAPAGCVEGDWLLCWAVTQGTEPATFSSANGFVQIPGSPFDGGLSSSSCLLLAVRQVGAGEDASDWAPTFNDPGNHLMAGVVRLDRVREEVDPLDAIANIVNNSIAGSSIDVAIPGVVTPENNVLVLGFCTTGADSLTPQFTSIATVSPHVTSSTVQVHRNTDQGNGSGLLMMSGEKAVAGVAGGWTATLLNAFRQVRVTLAILGDNS